MKRLIVSLPDDLRSLLEEAAKRNDRSLAEEIRQRLYLGTYGEHVDAKTFRTKDLDAKTRKFGDDVMQLARDVEKDGGATWHSHPSAHEAFGEAVATWLEGLKPSYRGAASDLFWNSADDPRTLGRKIARDRQRVDAIVEKELKDLRMKYRDRSKK